MGRRCLRYASRGRVGRGDQVQKNPFGRRWWDNPISQKDSGRARQLRQQVSLALLSKITLPIPRLSQAGTASRSEDWGGLFKDEQY